MRAQREFTVMSEAAQGPGTWVKFRRLTWDEIKPFIGKDMLEKVAAQIVDWNWTDEHGEPLPLPKTAADLGGMLSEETTFLINAATSYELGAADAKN